MSPANQSKTELLGGIVVFYNPEKNFPDKIGSYINQIDSLLIFDNSEVPDPDIHLLLRERYKNRVEIIAEGKNFGMGHALNAGLLWATRKNYSWLLTMDQDSSFYDDVFFNQFQNHKEKDKTAIFSPNHLLESSTTESSTHVTTNELIVMTSGNLLNIDLSKKIGSFNSSLFIDEVDHDYCLRARKLGFQVLKFNNIRLDHHLGEPLNVVKAKSEYQTVQHSSIRIYYIFRNSFFIFKTYFLIFPAFILKRILNLIVLSKDILFYHDDKTKKIGLAMKGFFHFLIGRYGKL